MKDFEFVVGVAPDEETIKEYKDKLLGSCGPF